MLSISGNDRLRGNICETNINYNIAHPLGHVKIVL